MQTNHCSVSDSRKIICTWLMHPICLLDELAEGEKKIREAYTIEWPSKICSRYSLPLLNLNDTHIFILYDETQYGHCRCINNKNGELPKNFYKSHIVGFCYRSDDINWTIRSACYTNRTWLVYIFLMKYESLNSSNIFKQMNGKKRHHSINSILSLHFSHQRNTNLPP